MPVASIPQLNRWQPEGLTDEVLHIKCRLSEYFDVSIDFLLGNDTITDSISLEDCFYNGVTYQELLIACHCLSSGGKQAVLAVVKALQEKNR